MKIEVYTLFDITETGNKQSIGLSRNQQRNWETLLQILGLRAQPFVIFGPSEISKQELSQYRFGSDYVGYASVWKVVVEVESEDTYLHDGDVFALLKDDANTIPMIVGLTESISITPACTCTYGSSTNLYFVDISHDYHLV